MKEKIGQQWIKELNGEMGRKMAIDFKGSLQAQLDLLRTLNAIQQGACSVGSVMPSKPNRKLKKRQKVAQEFYYNNGNLSVFYTDTIVPPRITAVHWRDELGEELGIDHETSILAYDNLVSVTYIEVVDIYPCLTHPPADLGTFIGLPIGVQMNYADGLYSPPRILETPQVAEASKDTNTPLKFGTIPVGEQHDSVAFSITCNDVMVNPENRDEKEFSVKFPTTIDLFTLQSLLKTRFDQFLTKLKPNAVGVT